MTKYLSYSEYQAYGGTLSEDDFNLAEFHAQKRIDYLTDTRVADMAPVPEEVKLCIMELIKVDQAAGVDAMTGDPLISSFNTDGYSESYGSASEQIAVLNSAMDKSINEMLYGVTDDKGIPLLYRGLDA